MLLEMKKSSADDITIFADITDHKFNGSTIPPDIISTKSRPDLVIVNRKAKKIELLELTCSFETNIEQANNKKYRRYLSLKSDLESEGWTVYLTPFEIGSRGHVTNRNKTALKNTFIRNHIKLNHKKLFCDLSKISLLCSFSIFQAHCEPAWRDPPLLHP